MNLEWQKRICELLHLHNEASTSYILDRGNTYLNMTVGITAKVIEKYNIALYVGIPEIPEIQEQKSKPICNS